MFDKGQKQSSTLSCDSSYLLFFCRFIRVSGSFDISASGLTFTLGINIGNNTEGGPKLTPLSCSCSLGSVNLKIHGGAAWFLNLFKGKIADAIKSALRSKVLLQKSDINTDFCTSPDNLCHGLWLEEV